MIATKQLTYEEIGRLKAEQDRLVAEGKMERPKIRMGFTPEEQIEFDKGIEMNELFNQLEKKYELVI
ncbi:MAG: hypothetical protein EZS26_000144 [Candidatus Ordinivivax streblomastigis]|uniref:Uncharacterized protein n=1 Tax=Candidatus Ordinivivax streblomastigis TaxID=2540710 RepID=A0A5M8P547_9BACT|nr:MAG: hypothetical protein EZS26_000144 [Candidatus Ordinivivax streblomastigis]MDR2844127.1 hypothetical protein [Candidatus Symbiothrix sp.]